MPNTWQPCPDGKPQVAHFQKRCYLMLQGLALHFALLQWHSFFKYCFSSKKPLFVIGGRGSGRLFGTKIKKVDTNCP